MTEFHSDANTITVVAGAVPVLQQQTQQQQQTHVVVAQQQQQQQQQGRQPVTPFNHLTK